MGLKADNAQIGQSGTATQNFNIRAPLDGTLRLSRGNAGAETSDPIKVEANNDVTLAGNLLSGVLGTGQTWQNMTASRVLGTTYTNTTGKPIQIAVQGNSLAGSQQMTCTVNGSAVPAGVAVVNAALSFAQLIIPTGATYSVSGVSSMSTWWELR